MQSGELVRQGPGAYRSMDTMLLLMCSLRGQGAFANLATYSASMRAMIIHSSALLCEMRSPGSSNELF